MHTSRIIALVLGACLAGLALGQPARADILISVDKTTQRMTVSVDGAVRYTWPVSTGRPGYDTPNGTFWALAKDKDHRSKEYDNAPMPYSIFFTKMGNAVHGTRDRGLGRPVSHGCVRLSVKNAAILWDLVSKEALYSTVLQISGSIPQSPAGRSRAPHRPRRDRPRRHPQPDGGLPTNPGGGFPIRADTRRADSCHALPCEHSFAPVSSVPA